MKIIDNKGRKDYYDHLAHIYGIDEKIILDRRTGGTPVWMGNAQRVILFVCDMVMEGWVDEKGKLYWQEDLEDIAKWIERDGCYRIYSKHNKWHYWNIYPELRPAKQKLNTETGVAICLAAENAKDKRGVHLWVPYPKLSDIGINKVINAQDMYLMLCEWLAPKDPISNPLSDKEKTLAAGFDLKDSFRNTK
jgi:hypothetical protein